MITKDGFFLEKYFQLAKKTKKREKSDVAVFKRNYFQ